MPVDNLSCPMQTIGNYELVEKIAEGGMGTVYRGRNVATGESVAVKVVPPHLISNAVVLKRFEQEYNVARAIDHPNIVKAIDFGRDGDTRFLVMEYVEGESLGQKIERDGRMEEAAAIEIITQVALGLQAAHRQGMIHRDVKPDNILITATGQAKLTDLGLVKEIEADLNLTRTGRGLGTPHFMAPEQFRNAKKADARCDIYSLGATLYMMVTGELPFQSNGPLDAWMKKINNEIDAPREHVPSLSERIDWAIRRAISPDPQHRPENCREFVEDLTGQSSTMLAGTAPAIEAANGYWYLVYIDEENTTHTVKGSVKGIRRSLVDGLLGDADNVRAARTKAGPFEPLRHYPEFRDLVIRPESVQTLRPDKKSPAASAAATTATPVGHADATGLETTTIIGAALKPAATKPNILPLIGPRIHVAGAHQSWKAEVTKWVLLLLFFGGIGVVTTILLPMLRYLRLF